MKRARRLVQEMKPSGRHHVALRSMRGDPGREEYPSMRKTVAAAILSILLLATPAHATLRILGSPGGTVAPFLALFASVNASGDDVVIDGPCLSACTLVLS